MDYSLLMKRVRAGLKSYREAACDRQRPGCRRGVGAGGRPTTSRVQTGDPTAHAEVVCIRSAGVGAIGRPRPFSAPSRPASCAPARPAAPDRSVVIGENDELPRAEDLLRHRYQGLST